MTGTRGRATRNLYQRDVMVYNESWKNAAAQSFRAMEIN